MKVLTPEQVREIELAVAKMFQGDYAVELIEGLREAVNYVRARQELMEGKAS